MADASLGTVPVALSPIERFEEYLQSKGKRVTEQRKVLVEQVFRQHDHFDADHLLAELSQIRETRKVSRPTVYRALAELVKSGLLRKMTLDGRAVYEHDYGYPQHDHLHCQECNKLIEFRNDEIQRIRDAIGQDHNFRVTGHRLIITGVCSDCSRQSRRKHSRLDLI